MSDAARPDGPIATGAAILDAPDEAGARAILARLLVAAGVEIVRSGWEPYDKLGAQSRIWFWWRPPAGIADSLAAVTALAEAATAPADRARISLRRDDDDPDAPSLAVVVASTVGTIAVPGLVWLDLDCDLAAEVQADLERALTS